MERVARREGLPGRKGFQIGGVIRWEGVPDGKGCQMGGVSR